MGRNARFYTLVLNQRSNITLDHTSVSGTLDTYVYLHEDHGKSGTVLAKSFSGRDDNGDVVSYISSLTTTLDSGDYTIEATTYSRVTPPTCNNCIADNSRL